MDKRTSGSADRRFEDEDAFGQHTRIADAIVNTIQDETKPGRAIALTGAWGSGKTFTLKDVKSVLEDDHTNGREYCVFLFDAWAHQGDSLARAFLHDLTGLLNRRNWIDQVTADTTHEALDTVRTHRREDKLPCEKREKTDVGVTLAASVLVPAGVAVIQSFAQSVWATCIGGWLLLLGALLIVGVNRSALKRQHESFQKNLDRLRFQYVSNTSLLPTSVEFRDQFVKLLRSSLDRNDGRTLVIVVENIDRLDSSDALHIWTILRTFYQFEAWSQYEWFKRYWLIVPFDEDIVRQADTGNGEKTIAFVDRLFRYRFHLPNPTLIRWHEFLEKRVQEAIPDLSAGDTSDIRRVFASTRKAVPGSVGTNRPTPRDISRFVDDLSTSWRQWVNSIPITHQALYIALRNDRSFSAASFEKGLTEYSNEIRRYTAFLGEDLRTSLASLHFALPAEEALHPIFESKIAAALDAADGESLAEDKQLVGFNAVLQTVVLHRFDNRTESPDKPGLVPNAAVALQQAGITDPQSWQMLRQDAMRIERWDGDDGNLADGIFALVNSAEIETDRVGFVERIVDNLARSLQTDTASKPPSDLGSFAQAVWRLFSALHEQPGLHNALAHFTLPQDLDTCKGFLGGIGKMIRSTESEPLASYFTPESGTELVASAAVAWDFTDDSFKDTDLIRTLFTVGKGWDWSPLVERVDIFLRNDVRRDKQSVPRALVQLLDLTLPDWSEQTCGSAETALSRLATDGIMFALGPYISNIRAAWFLCLLAYGGGARELAATPESRDGRHGFNTYVNVTPHELDTTVASLAVKYRLVERLLSRLTPAQDGQQLMAKIRRLLQCALEQTGIRGFPTADKAENWLADPELMKSGFQHVLKVMRAFESRLLQNNFTKFEQMVSFVESRETPADPTA